MGDQRRQGPVDVPPPTLNEAKAAEVAASKAFGRALREAARSLAGETETDQ